MKHAAGLDPKVRAQERMFKAWQMELTHLRESRNELDRLKKELAKRIATVEHRIYVYEKRGYTNKWKDLE